MLICIPEVLSKDTVKEFRQVMDQAAWEDGRSTAGAQSITVKNNEQLPQNSTVARDLGDRVLGALAASPLFVSAALPLRIFPPLFNRYGVGNNFGIHVDNAIRAIPGTPLRIRTDLSCTLFLAEPDEYDGGELIVEDHYGAQEIKLSAGDMVLYPSTSLHKVNAVTRGARVASFFWLQSMVRQDQHRSLLFDMDQTIQTLASEHGVESDNLRSIDGNLSQPRAPLVGGLIAMSNTTFSSLALPRIPLTKKISQVLASALIALPLVMGGAPSAAMGQNAAQVVPAAPGHVSIPGVVALTPAIAKGAGHALPHELSPWGMFMAADWVVKGVMILLALASVSTWTVWFAKTAEIVVAKRRIARSTSAVAGAYNLWAANDALQGKTDAISLMVNAGCDEIVKSDRRGLEQRGIKERVASELYRIELASGRQLASGLGLLATIGSTAPFVGLFGTVWGIMNSFIGISKSQTTNLAVVAPGIAEALLATAIGLAAAIPAVIFYNQITRSIGAYKASVGDGAALVQSIMSRDLDARKRSPDFLEASE